MDEPTDLMREGEVMGSLSLNEANIRNSQRLRRRTSSASSRKRSHSVRFDVRPQCPRLKSKKQSKAMTTQVNAMGKQSKSYTSVDPRIEVEGKSVTWGVIAGYLGG